MLQRARKIASEGVVYGLLLTAMVAAADAGGLFENLERWFYDKRAATCQFFTPPPTDRLVHLDIDDAVLDAVGSWPWQRAVFARMLDELRLGGPKVVALDLLLSEPQRTRFVPREDGKFEPVNDDQLLADALKRLDGALVPMSLPIVGAAPLQPAQKAMLDDLTADPEATESELSSSLAARGLRSPGLGRLVHEDFFRFRREAVYLRVRQAFRSENPSLEQLRAQLLRKTDASLVSPVVRVLEEQYARVTSELALRRFTRPPPPGIPPLLTSEGTLPPIPILAATAKGTAFFDYSRESDGKVRRVPLFIEHDGRMVPQIGLSMALMMLDQTLDDLRLTSDSVTLPRPARPPLRIPVYTIRSETLGRSIPMMFDIPWVGGDNWEAMYAKVGGAHLSMNVLWDICRTQQKIVENNRAADDALKNVLEAFSPEKLPDYAAHLPPLDDPVARLSLIAATLADSGPFLDQAASIPPKDRGENEAKLASAGAALRHVLDENPKLRAQLVWGRDNLRQIVHGKAVLIGWAATASLADLVSTSIHARVPGVVLHGTIFNAIMTEHLWRRVHPWVNLSATAVLGLLATLFASQFTPARAFLYAALLAAAYAAFNGLVLFDYFHRILDVSGPMIAVAIVWAGCTLARLLSESIGRARITRRFRSYVDPTLVNYLVDHPENVRLHGEVRELTVVFTDLEGFTSLAEHLGEKAVPLLNEFMGMAVPIIRSHGGYVNKFLGDGIMFFYGAPKHVPDHAARALATVLDLKAAMVELNSSLTQRGYPHLALRAGVSTGHMVVGDAGSIDASDYTVLGDSVNLGARLESANKIIGSRNLMNDRTAEMAGAQFLTRPIGKLCVMGKKTGVMTYEVLGATGQTNGHEQTLARLTADVVHRYMSGDLNGCLAAIEIMESAMGPDRLTRLYRSQCQEHLEHPPTEDFDCQIVLTEK